MELTFDSSSRPVAASGPQEWNTYSVLLTLDEFMDHRLVRKAVFRKHFILLCPLTEEEWYITQRDVIEMLSQMVPKEWCNRREGQ